MALQEIVERRFAGFAEDGSRIYSRTFTGRMAVTSLADWSEMRRAQDPHGGCTCPVGKVLAAFLDAAAGGEDYRAAVAAGAALDAHGRYRILRTLESWVKAAQDEYRPAERVARAMADAWARRWGAKPPRPVALA